MLEAVIGFVGILAGGLIGYLTAIRKSDTDLTIAREKLASENRASESAMGSIRQLLEHPDWGLRSFEAISKHIRGFHEDELRKLLVSVGAVAFEESGTERELWGLRERNGAKLGSGDADAPNSFDVEPPSPCM